MKALLLVLFVLVGCGKAPETDFVVKGQKLEIKGKLKPAAIASAKEYERVLQVIVNAKEY